MRISNEIGLIVSLYSHFVFTFKFVHMLCVSPHFLTIAKSFKSHSAFGFRKKTFCQEDLGTIWIVRGALKIKLNGIQRTTKAVDARQ